MLLDLILICVAILLLDVLFRRIPTKKPFSLLAVCARWLTKFAVILFKLSNILSVILGKDKIK